MNASNLVNKFSGMSLKYMLSTDAIF